VGLALCIMFLNGRSERVNTDVDVLEVYIEVHQKKRKRKGVKKTLRGGNLWKEWGKGTKNQLKNADEKRRQEGLQGRRE